MSACDFLLFWCESLLMYLPMSWIWYLFYRQVLHPAAWRDFEMIEYSQTTLYLWIKIWTTWWIIWILQQRTAIDSVNCSQSYSRSYSTFTAVENLQNKWIRCMSPRNNRVRDKCRFKCHYKRNTKEQYLKFVFLDAWTQIAKQIYIVLFRITIIFYKRDILRWLCPKYFYSIFHE